MKRSTLTLTLLLPAVCAMTAAAQLTVVRFVAPVSPLAGLPKLLPSPMSGPLAGVGISLPALTPTLVPNISLTLGAAPQAAVPAVLPVALPARGGQVQADPSQPSRDGVVNPLQRVMPGVVIRFAGAAPATAPQGASQPESVGQDSNKQKLDETFDGDVAPAKPAVSLPRRDRKPVTSGRRIGLPEDELLRELGF
jgi:hypothetical protein